MQGKLLLAGYSVIIQEYINLQFQQAGSSPHQLQLWQVSLDLLYKQHIQRKVYFLGNMLAIV